MKKLIIGAAGAALAAALTCGAVVVAAHADTSSAPRTESGHALPPARSADFTPQPGREPASLGIQPLALNENVGLPSGAYWAHNPAAVFGMRTLHLPSGTRLTIGQAQAVLGGGVADAGDWHGASARVWNDGSGWVAWRDSARPAPQAVISGPGYEKLYVLWGN